MSNPRPSSPNLVAYAGLVIAIAGFVWQGGNVAGDVKRNSDRIATLEASDKARSDRIQAIDVRTARIEAKLDYIVPNEQREK